MLLGEDRAGAELSWNQMLQDMDANNDMEIARDEWLQFWEEQFSKSKRRGLRLAQKRLSAMKEGLDSALIQRRASIVDGRVQPPNLVQELERVRTAIEEENTNSGANSEYTCSVP